MVYHLLMILLTASDDSSDAHCPRTHFKMNLRKFSKQKHGHKADEKVYQVALTVTHTIVVN